jgi:threonine synthase
MKYKLRCVSCHRDYKPEDVRYTCPACGDRLGTLEVRYEFSGMKLSRDDFDPNAGMWQFGALLPVEPGSYRTHLRIGGSPLYRFDGLLGFESVFVKYDGGNPSASFKDRASAVAVTKAFEGGFDTIYCASTGNAASSLAAIARPAGLETFIFLPATAPAAKIAQLFAFGARVIPIRGSYDEAFDLSLAVGKERGWYSRNSAINPYLLEGKKTAALEIAVQTGWDPPDAVLVAVGDGTVVSSFCKGFSDLKSLGLIDRVPRIIGIQAEGAAFVKSAFDRGEPFLPADGEAETVADSISVGMPRDVIKACSWVKASGGWFETVTDDEVVAAILSLAVETGVFAEPAGAVPWAGLKKIADKLRNEGARRVAIAVTGSGLKDIRTAERFVKLEPVDADLASVRAKVEKMVNGER